MTQEEVNKSLARPVAIIASALGIIQGLCWTTFGILCICCYFGAIEHTPTSTTWKYYEYIYLIFLKKVDATGNSDIIVTPDQFSIFMWIYIILGPAWIITSIYMLMGMIPNKWKRSKLAFGGWSTITLIISLVDIVFVGLLAHDYKFVDDNSLIYNNQAIVVTYGIVMSVAARGYLLWLINVIFALIIIKFTTDIVKHQNSNPRIPIIYGYDTTSIRPPWSSDSKNLWSSSGNQTPHYTNDAFVDDSRIFERSQSFFPSMLPEQANRNSFQSHNTNPNPPPIGFANDYSRSNTNYSPPNPNKVAKIGKPTVNMRPNNNLHNGPMIPEPDYTPPGTPTGLKSVLRSRSNY